MKLASPPDQCLAIVVGIEHYEAGLPTLHGPAIDALMFATWLRERGVPAGGIRLFVNIARDAGGHETPGADETKALKALMDDGVVREDPTRDALARLLRNPVRRADLYTDLPRPSMLVIYWSGHGVVEDRESDRYFYTTDATDTYQKAIDLSSTLKRFELDPALGRTFRQQLVIADACGQWVSEQTSEPVFDASPRAAGRVAHQADQCALWATAEGESARTGGDGGMSVFTGALIPALYELSRGDEGTADAWPDIDEVFEVVRAAIGKESGQRPTLYRKPPRQSEQVERFGRQSPAALRLAGILSKPGSLTLADLRPHFRRAAPLGMAMPWAADASVHALARLVGAEDATRFSPLALYAAGGLFACENRIETTDDVAARAELEATRSALQQWADDHADGPGWKQALDELRAPPSRVSHLVIDVPPKGLAIRAWLLPTDRRFVAQLGQDDVALAEALHDLIESARACCDQLIIELCVSFESLFAGFDRLAIARPPDAAGLADSWTLGRDFVTYLRLRERGSELSLQGDWHAAWKQIRAALVQAGATGKLRWLDDPRRPPNFTRAPFDTWLGIPGKPSEGPSNTAIQSALRRGAPLLVWPSVRASDVKACRTLADALIASTSIDDFAERWSHARDENPDIEDLHVLIDDPTRVPGIDERLQQPGQRKGP